MGLNHEEMDDDWAEQEAGLSPLQEEAIEWIARLTSGNATDAERVEFARWRERSPEHEIAADSARALWVGVGHVLAGAATPPVGAARAPARRRARPVTRFLALAASLLVSVGIAFQGVHNWRHDHVSSTNERDAFSLSDGTSVTLDGSSALDVKFSPDSRRVVLARGEAFFDVTHNAQRPFIVETAGGEVQVLGTAFSVRRDGNDMRVTVERGRVQVRTGNEATVLTRDQHVSVRQGHLSDVQSVDPGTELAWRRGRLIIEDETLGAVVKELNRYYAGHIVISNDKVSGRRVNAVIDLAHIDQWLAALDESQPIEIRRLGPVTLLR